MVLSVIVVSCIGEVASIELILVSVPAESELFDFESELQDMAKMANVLKKNRCFFIFSLLKGYA